MIRWDSFSNEKGLRQGDPLSPLLFNILVDMLAILTNRAKQVGQLSGLVPHLVDGGLSILQYADDTILFMVHDFEKAVNMKMLLCAFDSYQGSKSISTKVRFIALEKQKLTNSNMHNYLVVEKGTTRLDI